MTDVRSPSTPPHRDPPAFWVGDPDAVTRCCAAVTAGAVSVLATTPGGRPMRLVAYGEREPAARSANFNSAIGGREPGCYLDRAARRRPVVLLVGPVHGQETEGLTGLGNLIAIMETGHDRRGRPQAALRDLARQCRLLIIPDANPDGLARFEPRTLLGQTGDDLRLWGQGTWADGSLCSWPECKRLHPMAGPRVGRLGCYFNDDGVNPMHDEFFAPLGPEAPAILNLARAEGPEVTVSLHSHPGAPAVLRPAFVPLEVQAAVRDLGRAFYDLCAERGLPHGGLFEPQPEAGAVPSPFNLTSALYHVCGTVPFTFECPHGLIDERACHVTWEGILDIQLALYETILRWALAAKAAGPAAP
ncbi:MAG: hypothetical protein GX595_03605 [Lentisphaerae bacterium]|nr:hypothetical protein [Lentisphaerota bacterium]